VLRFARSLVLLAMAPSTLLLCAQAKDPLQSLVGKEVVLKIDMPGTQQGVDLRFNKDNPMDWKQYSGRLKSNGVAIHKGDAARVTAVVVKDDRIEFQLDGGGFGTLMTAALPSPPSQSTRAIMRSSWKEILPTPPTPTADANCSKTWIGNDHDGNDRKTITRPQRRLPARSRRKR